MFRCSKKLWNRYKLHIDIYKGNAVHPKMWGKECMDKNFSNLTYEIEVLQIGDFFNWYAC